MTIYGIPNCDTIKKTLQWMKDHKQPFDFHDYKKAGITKKKLEEWSKKIGWENILNKKSATWRALTPDQQATITNKKAAIDLMLQNPSIIKRPLIEHGEDIIIGFNDPQYQSVFSL